MGRRRGRPEDVYAESTALELQPDLPAGAVATLVAAQATKARRTPVLAERPWPKFQHGGTSPRTATPLMDELAVEPCYFGD